VKQEIFSSQKSAKLVVSQTTPDTNNGGGGDEKLQLNLLALLQVPLA
jgi:hypothetical protein